MQQVVRENTDFRISFIISVMVHALVAFILYLMQSFYFTPVTFEVQIVRNIPEERIIVEEEPIEIDEKINTQDSQKTKNKKNQPKTTQKSTKIKGKSGDVTEKSVTTKKTFADEFEKTLFTKKNSEKTAHIPSSTGSNWEADKRKGTPGKKEAGENIKVPAGNTSSGNTRWKKGGSRKLLKRPAIEYPASYRKQAMQGVVSLQIEVDSQGKVVDAEIVKSSGYPRLDLNARNAYRNALFSAAPGARENAVGIIDVYFKLKDN